LDPFNVTINFKPSDVESGYSATAFYTLGYEVPEIKGNRLPNEELLKIADALSGRILIPKICLLISGIDDCPQCSAGNERCNFEFAFKDMPFKDIAVVNVLNGEVLTKALFQTYKGHTAKIDSDLIQKAGGWDNIGLLLTPKAEKKITHEKMPSIKWIEKRIGKDK
jgi:hypothetical protein